MNGCAQDRVTAGLPPKAGSTPTATVLGLAVWPSLATSTGPPLDCGGSIARRVTVSVQVRVATPSAAVTFTLMTLSPVAMLAWKWFADRSASASGLSFPSSHDTLAASSPGRASTVTRETEWATQAA